ncbi:hypothetical protein WG909_03530 [Peptostreptococcaceae bacterium AGR-M142]
MKKISIIISLIICIFSFNISFAQEDRDEKVKSSIKDFLKLANLEYEEEKYDISIDYYNEYNCMSFVEITLKKDEEELYDFEIGDIDGTIRVYMFDCYLDSENEKKVESKQENFNKYKKASDEIFLNYLNTYRKDCLNLFDVNKYTYEISDYKDCISIYYHIYKDNIMVEDKYIKLNIDDNLNLIDFSDISDVYEVEEFDLDLGELKELTKKEVIKKVVDSIDLKKGYLCEENKKFNRVNLIPCYFDINYLDRYVDLQDNKVYIRELGDFNLISDFIRIELDKDIESKLKSKAILNDKIITEEEAKIAGLNIAKKYLSKGCYIDDITYDEDLEIYEMQIEDNSKTDYSAYIDIDKYGKVDYFDISYSPGIYSYTDEDINYKNIYSNAINLLKEIKPNLENINLNAVLKKTKEPKIIFYENIDGKDILNSYIEFSYSGKYLEEISDYIIERDRDNQNVEVLDYNISNKEALNMIKDYLEKNYNHVIFYNNSLDRVHYKVEFDNNIIDAKDKKFIDEYDYN